MEATLTTVEIIAQLKAIVPQGMMDRVCGWCGVPMGQKPGIPGEITHSMCPECFDNWMAQIEQRKQQKGSTK